MPMNEEKRGKKMLVFMIILLIIAAVIVFSVGRFFYNNVHYDEALMKKVMAAGFVEKQVRLPDGSLINYGEGPDNGPALLLIHGQTVAWEDYDTVLPELSGSFRVFAVDCFGHGGSSRDESLYSCRANGEALIWFIENVAGGSCYLSGHSSGGILAAWITANAPSLVKGLVLEDPPLFSVTPGEVQEGGGACAWYETYMLTNGYLNQEKEPDFTLYYLKNSYLFSLFGGLQEKIVKSARRYRQKNPGSPIVLFWVPKGLVRVLIAIDDYDPGFGKSFYDGSWMQDIDQENMLRKISCPAVYIKANTLYGKDGVLYAANTDDDADRVAGLINGCERINIKSGHDIHFEHPGLFVSACTDLLRK